jgi:hypothetical protein
LSAFALPYDVGLSVERKKKERRETRENEGKSATAGASDKDAPNWKTNASYSSSSSDAHPRRRYLHSLSPLRNERRKKREKKE